MWTYNAMRSATSTSVTARWRRSRYSFRAFYITTLLLCSFAIVSLVSNQAARYTYGPHYGIARRNAVASVDATWLQETDKECRLVHYAKDKCAFVKANCADEEAGFFSYLSMYYCSMPDAQLVAFIILVLWLGLLFSTIGIAASDFFCVNLSTIATILGMSESMAGVTFLAFGNGSPDVFSTFAAMNTHSGSLAIGELIGAAGFITAVVAGSMALVREFKVGKRTFVRDVGFFIVAISFSMIFLADETLYIWECFVMIGFYLFYVLTVVMWHWYFRRRKERKDRAALARGHYLIPGNEETEIQEEQYHDDEEAPARRGISRAPTEDFDALERASGLAPEEYSDESDGDGEQGRLLATEMTNSMRVLRAPGKRRNTTINQIRPSLVGALEFRSVLSSLQKSRTSRPAPVYLRRYSDDPNAFLDHRNGIPEDISERSDYSGSVVVTSTDNSDDELHRSDSAPRGRAVSMIDPRNLNALDSAPFSATNIPVIGVVSATPTLPHHLNAATTNPTVKAILPSPTISISPPPSRMHSAGVSAIPKAEHLRTDDRLAPPSSGYPGARHLRTDFFQPHEHLPMDSARSPSPGTLSPRKPVLVIPHLRDSSENRMSSPVSPFPIYTDSPRPITAQSSRAPSLLLPEPTINSDRLYVQESIEEDLQAPIKWWPYHLLPDPRLMASTLFPTLCNWREKSILDKFLSVISAPSIFLLAVTLPIVETESKGEEDETETERLRSMSLVVSRLSPEESRPDEEPEWIRYRRSTIDHGALGLRIPKSPALRSLSVHGGGPKSPALRAISGHSGGPPVEERQQDPQSIPLQSKRVGESEDDLSSDHSTNSSGVWNRWLVMVQIFTAPLFVLLIVWAGTTDDRDVKYLPRLLLYSTLGSLVALAILLVTTTPDKVPRYRPLLCFVGFVVSISWISTIASEVVGVLKAFGVIFGISDAILGLTIFAVGNSLGDLVADVTVARLGYPVMALSACFGGPMLNILLGVGISGVYVAVQEANHKHVQTPGEPVKYKPYEIAVGSTLMISAVTLLITLVGLLIVVPMNNWMMTRKIGWGLITLWLISTVANLVVEITGVFGDTV